MDDYGAQSARIVQAAKKLCPSCEVTFDADAAPRRLRFRIEDGSVQLTKAWPHYHVSEVADVWSRLHQSELIVIEQDGLLLGSVTFFPDASKEVTDWSDEKLRQVIEALTGSLVGQSV